MNSFNHYAYGSVAYWMYAVPGGIRLDSPGYSQLTLQPIADKRLEFFETSIDTQAGTIRTRWQHTAKETIYTFDTPANAIILLPGQRHLVTPGHHEFRITGQQ